MDIAGLFSQLVSLIQSFGSLSAPAKIAGIVLFIVAVVKSSFVQPLWAKLGNAQVLVAPILAVIVSIVSIQPFSWAALWSSLLSGALAIGMHQLLDAVKTLPGIGSAYLTVINFVESILQAPESVKEKTKALKASLKK
jgi:hypothetical protein